MLVVIHQHASVVLVVQSKLYNLWKIVSRYNLFLLLECRCQWPCCSPHCEEIDNPNSHGLECSILKLGPGPRTKASGDITALTNYYRADALLVLKCLLLQKQNPKKWKKLMDMQSHEEDRKGSELQEYVIVHDT